MSTKKSKAVYETLNYEKLLFQAVMTNNSRKLQVFLCGGDYSQDGQLFEIYGLSSVVRRHLLNWLIDCKKIGQNVRGAELPEKFWVGGELLEDGEKEPRLLIDESKLSLDEMIAELSEETPRETFAIKAVALRGQRRTL